MHECDAAEGTCAVRWTILNCADTGIQTFICQSQRDYDRMLRLNGLAYPARKRMDGSIADAGKVALNLAVIEFNEETANPPRPCTPQKVSGFDTSARLPIDDHV